MDLFVVMADETGCPGYTTGIYSSIEKAEEVIYQNFGRKLIKEVEKMPGSGLATVKQYVVLNTVVSINVHQVDY